MAFGNIGGGVGGGDGLHFYSPPHISAAAAYLLVGQPAMLLLRLVAL